MKKSLGFVMGLLVVVCMAAWTLSPPQYGLWRQINGSIGASPNVDVKEIYESEGINVIDIIGSDPDVCNGLAFVLRNQYNFGGINVSVRVLDRDGKLYAAPELKATDDVASVVKKHFENALRDNPYFVRTFESSGFFIGTILWVECKPAVIQFFNDNIGDYYGNNNYVAADVFEEVCQSQFGEAGSGTPLPDASISIGFTTAPVKNDSQASAYRQYP